MNYRNQSYQREEIMQILSYSNAELSAQNLLLKKRIERLNSHPAIIATRSIAKTLLCASIFGLLATFIRPDQRIPAIGLGAIFGMSINFISKD